jgi:chemotaxis response regulator CheB
LNGIQHNAGLNRAGVVISGKRQEGMKAATAIPRRGYVVAAVDQTYAIVDL